jgi:ATP-dependent DNA ligase
MLLLRTEMLPEDGVRWAFELKHDGFRSIAFKTDGRVHLCSSNDKDFSAKYPAIVKALSALPDETTIDGEVFEWTADDHLRHTRFMGLRPDKKAQDVGRER